MFDSIQVSVDTSYTSYIIAKTVEVRALPEPSLIRHDDVQFGLQRLGLPLITLGGPCSDTSCGTFVVDDDDNQGVDDGLLEDPVPICDGQALAPDTLPCGSWDWGDSNGQDSQSGSSVQPGQPEDSSQSSSQLPLVPADSSSLESTLVEIGTGRRDATRWNVRRLGQLSQIDFQLMHPVKCVTVAAKATSMLANQNQKYKRALNQLKVMKRQVKRQKQQLSITKQRLVKAMSKTVLDIVPVGKTGKRMSKSSAFAIGIRRNMSNISAADFGSTIMMDLSHQRVTRSEVKTGAAILSRMRCFSNTFLEGLYRQESRDSLLESLDSAGSGVRGGQPGCSEFSLMTVSFRCDATNSSIWKREKLHVLDVDMAMVTDIDALRKYDASRAIEFRRCLLLIIASANWSGLVGVGSHVR